MVLDKDDPDVLDTLNISVLKYKLVSAECDMFLTQK